MFLLKLLCSVLISTFISPGNTVVSKAKVGRPHIYQEQMLLIPKIGLKEPFIIGNWAMDNFEYIQLAPYSNLPNEKNAHLIFMAHSGNSKISYFKNIEKLNYKDSIFISFENKTYHYSIYQKIIISPHNTEALYYRKNNIILLTCYKNKYRIVIYGQLKTVNKLTVF